MTHSIGWIAKPEAALLGQDELSVVGREVHVRGLERKALAREHNRQASATAQHLLGDTPKVDTVQVKNHTRGEGARQGRKYALKRFQGSLRADHHDRIERPNQAVTSAMPTRVVMSAS
jgi:hypothetical protein